MSIKWKFGIWTVVMILITVLFVPQSVEPDEWGSGNVFYYTLRWGQYFEIPANKTVAVFAESDSYFRLKQDSAHQLYGVPRTPPEDSLYEDYFVLEGEVGEGQWNLIEGDYVRLRLESEDLITITFHYQSPLRKGLNNAVPYLVIWGLGLLAISSWHPKSKKSE